MHLHQLSFGAIGPFPGEHTIDFDRLGASGLFLLEGPTGAGKSTIIDAIVFALYGGLAGEESSKQRLHSHHAEPGVEPYVDLTFSTQSGDYRIRRSPAHERPKNRGTGTTMQNESAKLSRLASLAAPDRGEEISTRTQEIGNEIKEIVGLDRQQFLQTVVLPQGEFAKFLRSTGENRKDLLRTIFRTDVYESVTDQLKLMRNQSGRAIDEARARVAEAFAGFAAASEHDFAADLDESDFDGLEEVCADAAASLVASAAAARSDNEKAQTQLVLSRGRHQEETLLAGRLKTRVDLLAKKALLAEQADGVELLRARIEEAHRAARVSLSIEGLRKAVSALETAATQLADAEQTQGTPEGVTTVQLIAGRDDLAAEITALGQLLEVDARLPERRLDLHDRRQKRAALAQRIDALRGAVASAPAEIEGREKQLAGLQKSAQSLPDLHAKVEQGVRTLEGAEAVKATVALLAQAMARRDELTVEADQANDEVRDLRKRRLDGYAGVLSRQLEDGVPCAVCGSEQHPAPATLHEDHPSDADIDAAEERFKGLMAAVEDAAADVHTHKEELARRHEQARGLEPDQARAALYEAREQESAALSAQQEVEPATTTLDVARKRLAHDDRQLTEAKVDLAVIDADLATLGGRIEVDATRIADAIRGRAEGLARLVADLRGRRELVERVIAARDVHAAAVDTLDGRQEELDLALKASDFASIEQAEAGQLDDADLQTLTAQVREYDRHHALVSDRLADPEIAGLTGEESTDVDTAVRILEQAQIAARESQKLVDVLAAREESASRALSALTTALTVHRAAVAESGAIVRLAGVAEGSHLSNVKKVSLGTYVLMRRFDDVVAAANVRYAPMSNGRYQLVRIEEKEGKGGGRRTGLALAIQDGETGTQREPRTLSGGETFNASLSLALGLADVVTGEAGGIELGTLFVDEGFGTLDAESLDRVMSELGKLSKGGRMVGIVSHVDELKQRVAERVEVRRMPTGASTLTVRAEGESLPELSAV